MEKATETFEKYINFWLKIKPSVTDKILFCIYKGLTSPVALRQKLDIAKGNLANYCKRLVKENLIVQHTHGRAVEYELAQNGKARVNKLLEAIKNVAL